MKKEMISIIVPVYNAESYVQRCVKSLINQTYKNIEILLIDDGSKDNSYAICKELERIDCRVHAYTQKNAGPSSARNKGLDLVSGEYIAFVDSDDYAEENMYETLLNNLKKHLVGLSMVGMQEVFCNGEKRPLYRELGSQVIRGNEIDKFFFKYHHIMFSPVNKLYPREVIGEIRFDESIRMSEDQKFNYEVLKKVKNIYYDSLIGYNIDVTDNSLSRAKATKYHMAMLDVNEYIIKDTKSSMLRKLGRAYNAELSLSYFVPYYYNGEFKEENINHINQIIKENKKYVILYGDKRTKIKLCIFYISPKFLGRILKRKRQKRD